MLNFLETKLFVTGQTVLIVARLFEATGNFLQLFFFAFVFFLAKLFRNQLAKLSIAKLFVAIAYSINIL